MAHIDTLCISKERGIVKTPISEAEFITNYGIKGDAHAGDWHRQVSILAGESIDRMKQTLPDLAYGAFAENIVTRGLNFQEIKVGDKLQIGKEIILEITQIGKECHSECAIGIATGDCIMPKEGVFAKVLNDGKAKTGDEINIILFT